MQLLEKIQSTKVGIAGAAIAILLQMEASPWCISPLRWGICFVMPLKR